MHQYNSPCAAVCMPAHLYSDGGAGYSALDHFERGQARWVGRQAQQAREKSERRQGAVGARVRSNESRVLQRYQADEATVGHTRCPRARCRARCRHM